MVTHIWLVTARAIISPFLLVSTTTQTMSGLRDAVWCRQRSLVGGTIITAAAAVAAAASNATTRRATNLLSC